MAKSKSVFRDVGRWFGNLLRFRPAPVVKEIDWTGKRFFGAGQACRVVVNADRMREKRKARNRMRNKMARKSRRVNRIVAARG
jgi:hypothetical protein